MGLNLRKTIVGLSVLVILLGAYVTYTRVGGSTPVSTQAVPQPDANDLVPTPGDLSGQVGSGTQIQRIRGTQLIHTDATGAVDRNFGFEDLSHPEGKQWEATHPFMTLYQPGFKCSVTADKGQVQTESDFGRLIPNDALFSGHVVIHISASDPNNTLEAFIYLDDVAFTAAKSLFSTSGPVRFISPVARLTGRGMELLYDEQRGRLELFRVQDLVSLLLRSEALQSLMKPPDRATESKPARPGGSRPEAKPPENAAPVAKAASPAPVAYECVLRKNVQIVTPKEIARAYDQFAINNILWAGPKTEESGGAKAATKSSDNRPKPEPNEPPGVPSPRSDTTRGSNALTLESMPESLFDVVVTCKGGMVVRPMGTAAPEKDAVAGARTEEVSGFDETADASHQVIAARRIDVDASTGDADLPGPVRMTLWVDSNSLSGSEGKRQKVPLLVTSEKVRYFAALKQIVLEGDCMETAQWPEPNGTGEFVMKSPRLTLDLVEDSNAVKKSTAAGERKQGGTMDVRHAVASGGFDLRIQRKNGLEVIGGVEMHGTQLDYDKPQDSYVATGPGYINLYNSEKAAGGKDANDFSLRQPCYAFLRNFDRLTYSGVTNRIVGESALKQLQLDYFPLVNGRMERHIEADVGHVEAQLTPPSGNRMDLVTLEASEGIAFREGVRQLDGSTLFYDHTRGLMTIRGDANTPCYFNGTLVDGVEVDVKTGQAKANVIAPSTFGIK